MIIVIYFKPCENTGIQLDFQAKRSQKGTYTYYIDVKKNPDRFYFYINKHNILLYDPSTFLQCDCQSYS